MTYDLVVVGAGFSGMYAIHLARKQGLSVVAIEAGTDVGGTWYWNRYPGARCDVESIDYSYSFSDELQHEWEWTERYASQPEILSYARHVADRFDLRRSVRFQTRVRSAHFDEAASTWKISTDTGEIFEGRYCLMATGPLSEVKQPDFAGLEGFEGDWYHTARWPEEGVDFQGKRVGIVGTGSTGVQLIPKVAEEAEEAVVFQRTPNYVVPARNRPLEKAELDAVKSNYRERRQAGRRTGSGVPSAVEPGPGINVSESERRRRLEEGWTEGGAPSILRAYNDTLTDESVNETAAKFVREKIHETVRNPEYAEALTPRDHPLGSKRLCVGTDYYETYNRDNVTLVNLRETPIEGFVPQGVKTTDRVHELDAVVFAIGFDAISGALAAIDIRGRNGRSLRDAWETGPQALFGIQVAGFPNLFLVNGPGAPAVLGNVLAFLEYHVEWTLECIAQMDARGVRTIEADPVAQSEWNEVVDATAAETLYTRAKSWFTGANIDGKPQRFLPFAGGFHRFQEITTAAANNGYEGFLMDGVPAREISYSASQTAS